MPDTGDTPHLAIEPALVDAGAGTGHNPPAEGDEPLPGVVRLVEDTSTYHPPTAGELRATGYVVPEGIEDSAVPTTVIESDQPLPAGEVNLYVPEPNPTSQIPPLESPAESQSAEQEAAAAEEPETAAETADEAAQAGDQEDPNFVAGRQAALDDQPRSDNPHDGRRAEGRAWFRGYDSIVD